SRSSSCTSAASKSAAPAPPRTHLKGDCMEKTGETRAQLFERKARVLRPPRLTTRQGKSGIAGPRSLSPVRNGGGGRARTQTGRARNQTGRAENLRPARAPEYTRGLPKRRPLTSPPFAASPPSRQGAPAPAVLRL